MLRKILNLAPEGAVAAPPAPATNTPSPAPAAPEPSNDLFDDPDLKSLETPPKPELKTEPKKPDTKAPDTKVPDKKPDAKAPDVKPADKKPDAPTPDVKVEPAPESMGIKQLRQRGDKALADLKSSQEKITALEAKLADYDKKDKDSESVVKRVAELEKQLEERDKKLYALNVAESKDFQERYVAPYNSAAEDAKSAIERMDVQIKDADGNVTATRPASWENDFAQVFHLNKSSVTKANAKAREIFGDDAPMVMNMVHSLYGLDKARVKALSDLQTNANANRDKEIAEGKARQEYFAKAWRDINTDLAEKNPEYFQPDPKDKQRAELFTKSLALVDARHNGKALTDVQQVTLDAQVRLRAAAFPVLKYDNAKLKDEIATLQAEIAELRRGPPGDTQHQTGATAPAAEKTVLEELDEVFKD
jgi:hypothetical protein